MIELKCSLFEFWIEVVIIVYGDIKYSNWVIIISGLIYLVDWDFVCLIDCMYDVVYILSYYIL